jgi:hypothetical protein
MGLDMYLYVRKYVPTRTWTDFENANPEFARLVEAVNAGQLTEEGSFTGASVDIPVMYWRKENHIHRWFVANCQDGVDECQISYVSRQQLVELRDMCQAIVDQPQMASSTLPTQSGFFFGGTEYDDWYMEGTRYTAARLTELLERVPEGDMEWSFCYQSSW